jgi:hypothetical protein
MIGDDARALAVAAALAGRRASTCAPSGPQPCPRAPRVCASPSPTITSDEHIDAPRRPPSSRALEPMNLAPPRAARQTPRRDQLRPRRAARYEAHDFLQREVAARAHRATRLRQPGADLAGSSTSAPAPAAARARSPARYKPCPSRAVRPRARHAARRRAARRAAVSSRASASSPADLEATAVPRWRNFDTGCSRASRCSGARTSKPRLRRGATQPRGSAVCSCSPRSGTGHPARTAQAPGPAVSERAPRQPASSTCTTSAIPSIARGFRRPGDGDRVPHRALRRSSPRSCAI